MQHEILLHRLAFCFGISGTVLEWFTSNLSRRTQSVKVNGILSVDVPLMYGVPQGSVLGQILFSLYTTPLNVVIQGFHTPPACRWQTNLYKPIPKNPTSPPCNITSQLCRARWLKIGSYKERLQLICLMIQKEKLVGVSKFSNSYTWYCKYFEKSN